ncbi:peptidase inhibitor family I36 protein [Sphaerisporangium aureirubrum]|uniref:Peptidase inhibitor family I36 protein n=1 Tax=Sphaerisporangium aureirubrum TaxID=1544736 RepID=A0ABW1NVJ2_9ACTN
MRSRTRTVRAALAAAGMIAVALAAPAPAVAMGGDRPESDAAALQRAREQCGGGEVCFWYYRDYAGQPWRWMPSNGYRDMPSNLHDHVYSFYANASACFIDWDPAERRKVNIGDYAKVYDTSFGRRIDAVGPPDMC